MKRSLGLAVWVTGLTLVVLALTAMPETRVAVPIDDVSALRAWAEGAAPDALALEMLKVVTLAASLWTLGALLFTAFAQATGARRAAGTVARTLPRRLRVLVRPATAAVLSASLTVGSTGMVAATELGTQGEPAVLVHLGTVGPPTSAATPSPERLEPATLRHLGPSLDTEHTPLVAPHHSPPPPHPAPVPHEQVWVVEPGDHLWSIASGTLAQRVESPVPLAAVGEYWLRLIEANRDRLPDPANPDLIYPDMEIVLPD